MYLVHFIWSLLYFLRLQGGAIAFLNLPMPLWISSIMKLNHFVVLVVKYIENYRKKPTMPCCSGSNIKFLCYPATCVLIGTGKLNVAYFLLYSQSLKAIIQHKGIKYLLIYHFCLQKELNSWNNATKKLNIASLFL